MIKPIEKMSQHEIGCMIESIAQQYEQLIGSIGIGWLTARHTRNINWLLEYASKIK